ncbi:hypothetical protein [Anaerotignum sp.]|uniref:beta strand repeat-containing protein n=1 Tax=Anaerotignum sp. TaxID=2039241 RepID=UPI003320D839
MPCDKGCTDTNEDGVIDHVDDCAYIPAVAETPAVEGAPCNHEHDENCGYTPASEGVVCGFLCEECEKVLEQPALLGSPRSVTNYDVWVGSTQVTSDNASDITGTGITGTVSYDADTNTLTLDNATITHEAGFCTNSPFYSASIYSKESGTINLIGSNSINLGGGSSSLSRLYNISVDKPLTITGSGSLALTAGNATGSSTTTLASVSLGSTNGGTLTIDGGTVTMINEQTTPEYVVGIYDWNVSNSPKIELKNAGNLSITSKKQAYMHNSGGGKLVMSHDSTVLFVGENTAANFAGWGNSIPKSKNLQFTVNANTDGSELTTGSCSEDYSFSGKKYVKISPNPSTPTVYGDFLVSVVEGDTAPTFTDGVLTFAAGGEYTVAMKSGVTYTSNAIVVNASDVTLNLDGITIGAPQGKPDSDGVTALTVTGGTVLNIVSDSSFTGGVEGPGTGESTGGGAGIKGNIVVKGNGTLTATGGNSNGDTRLSGMGIVGSVNISGAVSLIAKCGSGVAGIAITNGIFQGGNNTVAEGYTVWCGDDPINIGPLLENSTTNKYVKIVPTPEFVDFTKVANQNTLYAESLLGTDKSTWSGNDTDGFTLTLNGVDFSTSAPIAIKLPDNTTVVCTGVNVITSTYDGTENSSGIYADGSVTFIGTGVLTATGGTTSNNSCGIGSLPNKTITIGGNVTVVAIGGKSTGQWGNSRGISAGMKLIITDLANVTATGGDTAFSNGLYSNSSGESQGIRFVSGTLFASGNTQASDRLVYAGLTGTTEAVATTCAYNQKSATWELKLPTAAQYADGSFDGTEAASGRDYEITGGDTLHIKTAKGGAWWSANGSSYLDYAIYLDNDIDVSAFLRSPVGNGTLFSGTLDGQGHSISGLTIDSTENYAGLLKSIGGARIQNLCIASGSVKSTFGGAGDLYVGGITGVAASRDNGTTTIGNCFNTCSVTAISADSNAIAGAISGFEGDIRAATR